MINQRWFNRLVKLLKQPRKLVGCFIGPRVLAVSVPKAGANMVVRTLTLFPYLRDSGALFAVSDEVLCARISKIKPGQVLSVHIPPKPSIISTLEQCKIKVVFIIRDPRDVCVSLMYYIIHEPSLLIHRYLNSLPDKDQRLLVTITGHYEISSEGKELWINSADYYFRELMSWSVYPNCTTVKFEDLVGPLGGGGVALQVASIKQISSHLELPLTNKDIEIIAKNIFSSQYPTFRRGQIGSWREEFSPEHRRVFKEIAGQLLIELGYENGLDW